MEPGVDFIEGDWDEKCELSTMHLSYLLQTLFPLHVIKWDSTKRHYENIKSKLANSIDETIEIVVTGSMSEGYSIPPSIDRTKSGGKSPEVEILSDVDTLWVGSQLKVSTEELIGEDTSGYKAYFEYIDNRPGYVRICLPSTKKPDETFIFDESSGKYYLSGTKYTDKMFEVLLSKKVDVTKQGPAISMIDELHSGTLFHVKDGISKDLVLALPCYPWPSVADAWKERVSQSHWIRSEIVDAIIKDGCHVVGVPSKQSRTPDLEWRLSFSASEGKLAREVVTDYQRQCFIYVKILHHQKVKPLGILSSYVFKSVFLHCCERLHVSHWKDYPGSCILYILDVVIDCLRRKHVPTFFLPENNLVGHLTDEEFRQAIASVEGIRRDPITPVLEFTDNRLFSHHSVYMTFREMVEPLLQDMTDFKEHRNKEMSVLKGIVATGYRICNALIAETSTSTEASLFKHQEGIRSLIDVYTFWLKPMSIDAPMVEYVDKAGLALKDPKWHLAFFEAVVSLESEYPEFASLRPKLARMYHRAACSKDVTAAEKGEYVKKAERLYEHVYKHDKGLIIDYALLIMEQKRYADAQKILEKFLHDHTADDSAIEITFDYTDKEFVGGQLKAFIETTGNITGDIVSFALYFLVVCVLSRGYAADSQEVLSLLEKFDGHYCENQNENTHRLLNLAKTFVKENGDNVSYFGFLYGHCSIL